MDENISSDIAKAKRKKFNKLCTRIRKQLEFYFSDSNLSKDKFLSDLISKDPHGYVDIEVFKSFNKIKVLIEKSETESCLLIASAAGRSKMFEVSADHRRLRRTTPVHSKDFDAYTLYVEKLPFYANQTWVRDKFCHFGTIRSINVPRYKVTSKVKGFAFIEFENVESVKKACEVWFEYYKVTPDKECSASEDENKNVKNVKKNKNEDISDKKNKSRTRSISESSDKMDFSSSKSDQHVDATEKHLDPDHSPQKNKRKRKREDSDSETTAKKPKETTDEDPSTSVIASEEEPKLERSGVISEHKQAELKEQAASASDAGKVHDSDMNGTEMKEKKSKRRRRKKHRSNQEQISLRVMPKTEWKVYRNKYLDLQRSTMKFLKQQFMLEASEWKEQESHVKAMDVCEPKKPMEFVPDVIIKVKLLNPIKNSSEIKDQIKSNAVVAYIDAPIESTEVFIRCHNSDDAEAIIREEKLSQLGNTELLKGEEEKMYWEKLQNDRRAKYNNPVPHKKRGRDKLLAKAAKFEEIKNKHIFYDD